ncbi:efflux RND transporter periplasmic adaptor subunit [Enterococcus sp. LJL120]
MNHSEKVERFFKKTKTWNMVLLIIVGLGVIMGIANIPTTLNPQMADISNLPEETIAISEQLFAFQDSLVVKAYAIITLLIDIAVVVLLFKNNRNLNQEKLPYTIPYYLQFVLVVVNVIYTLVLTPQIDLGDPSLSGVSSLLSVFSAIGVVIGSLFVIVPALMALLNLRKVKRAILEADISRAELEAEKIVEELVVAVAAEELNEELKADADKTEIVAEAKAEVKADEKAPELAAKAKAANSLTKTSGTRKKEPRFSKKQKIIFGVLGGVAAVVLLVGGMMAFLASQNNEASALPSYTTAEVTMADPLTFNGTVEAEQTSDVYLDATKGRISEILVANGQEVAAGTPILSYQSDEVAEQVKTAEQQLSTLNLQATNASASLQSAQTRKNELQADLTTARNRFNGADANSLEGQATRQEQQALIDQYTQSITAQDDVIQQAQQAVDAANLEVSNANSNVEDLRSRVATQVTADIDGIAIVNEEGQISATVPVIQVVSKATVIKTTVSEYDYHRIVVGRTVTARAVSSDQSVNGTITQVNLLPDAAAAAAATGTTTTTANYTFTVKPESDLQYGYSCQVTLPLEELRIPASAVVTEGEMQFAYQVVDDQAVKTAITAEDQSGVTVVREGLEQGAEIITNPDDQLTDGLEVMVN